MLSTSFFTLHLRFVTHAVNDQRFFKAFGHAFHHVVDKRPVKTVLRSHFFLVVGSGQYHFVVFDFYTDIFADLLTERAFRTFNGDKTVFGFDFDSLRYDDRHSTYS